MMSDLNFEQMDAADVEDVEIVSPGPIDRSVLTQQRQHRSNDICEGEVKTVKYLVSTPAKFISSLNYKKYLRICVVIGPNDVTIMCSG